MKLKIRVHGKSQSRTALGIINAYLKLYPDATPADVQRAFPKSLNRKCNAEHLIIPVEETRGYEKMFFEQEDELVVFKNGAKFALVEVWTKDDFIAICEHAKQYGIVAAKEGTRPFEKGSFELEYLDETKKKRKFSWWWILALLVLLLLLLLCCRKCSCSNPKCTTAAVETVIPAETGSITVEAGAEIAEEYAEADASNSLIVDNDSFLSVTLPDGNVLNIAKNSPEFNLFSFLNSSDAIETGQTKGLFTLDKVTFENGKAELTREAEEQLKNVARILQFFPDARIKVGGYTDNTGTDEVNLYLSTERARASAGQISSSGVEAGRVSYEGYGSQHPVCPPNNSAECRAANRRVDIRVTQK